MGFSANLAERIRALLKRRRGVTERKMFGGIAFMQHGHLVCGVIDDLLVLRLGEEGAGAALTEKHTRPMDFTGKPMRSMIYVEPTGTDTDDALKTWVQRALAYVKTLPPNE